MNKILLITDYFYPKPLANGICLAELAKSLTKNFEVHTLSMKNFDDTDLINVRKVVNDGMFYNYYIRDTLINRMKYYGENNRSKVFGKLIYFMFLFFHRLKRLLLILFFPLNSPMLIFRFYKEIKKLYKINSYDIILCTYCPLEPLIAISLLKKQLNFKSVFYILDAFTNVGSSRWFSSEFLNRAGLKWENRLFSKTDLILMMETHKNFRKKNNLDQFYNIEYVDIPLICEEKIKLKEIIKGKKIYTFLYAGALYAGRRDPNYLCDLIYYYNQNNINKISLKFYTRGGCDNLIDSYTKKSNEYIMRKGYIEKEKLMKELVNIDVLISIGNKGSQMVPSKIFEYISSGNKIIHFYYDSADSSLIYLKKYPNCLCIKIGTDLKRACEFINEFIKMKSKFEYIDTKTLYEKNMPEYTNDLISKLV